MSDHNQREQLEGYVAAQFDELVDDQAMFPDQATEQDWEWQALKQALGNVSGRKVLDVGCAKGKFSGLLAAHGAQVTGIDVSPKLIEVAKKNVSSVKFEVGSATAIPAEDAQFDAAICVEVLEHVPDINLAIREMARVLKPGGTLIIIDKNILGLHPVWMYPMGPRKWWLEQRGKWMYPSGASYREQWFTGWGLSRQLKQAFGEVTVTYVERERTPWAPVRKLLIPWLAYDVLWRAVK